VYFPACSGSGITLRAPAKRAETSRFRESDQANQGHEGTKQPVLTQDEQPSQLSAEQIVASSDANIDPDQGRIKAYARAGKKTGLASIARCTILAINGADRLNLRIARAKRDPPDDIIEQCATSAVSQRPRGWISGTSRCREPLFASLDAKQKAIFIEEMVRLSHERGPRLRQRPAGILMEEKRKDPRTRSHEPAYVSSGGSVMSCMVRNIRRRERQSMSRTLPSCHSASVW